MKYLVLSLLFTSQLTLSQPVTKRAIHDLKMSISELFDDEWTQHQFSGVLLVAKNGKPIYCEAKGYKDFEKKIAMRTNDVFELASVSKQFTSMIIMMLKELGKLGYDDPLDAFIKDLPFKGIRLRHLLTHTSGLPDYQSIMDRHWNKNKVADNLDIIDYLKKYPEPLHFAPGERYEYSNTGFVLLASVAEVASGMDFIELVKKWIFTPLKMKSADFRTPISKAHMHNLAKGYIYDSTSSIYKSADLFKESNYTIWLGNRKGPGRISMNACDLLKWDQALHTPFLVASITLDEAFSPFILNNKKKSNYGFGWELKSNLKLGKVVHHSGDNPGYHTHIMRFIDKNYTIILLNNNASDRMNSILDRVEEMITDLGVY